MVTTSLWASEKHTKPSAKFLFTTMSTTSLWASEKRMKPSDKFMFTTRRKKLGTIDADIPTAKTGKVISTTRLYGFFKLIIQSKKKILFQS